MVANSELAKFNSIPFHGIKLVDHQDNLLKQSSSDKAQNISKQRNADSNVAKLQITQLPFESKTELTSESKTELTSESKTELTSESKTELTSEPQRLVHSARR